MSDKFKKFSLAATLLIFIFTSSAGSFLLPQPANAQVTIIGDVQRTAQKVIDVIFDFLKVVVLNAVIRVVAYGMRKIAYDSAVWLASGGKGQGAFAHTKDFGKYLESVGDEAVGAGIEELGKPYGLNLCKIPDIKVDLNMRIGLRLDLAAPDAKNQPKPNCSLSEFKKNWLEGDAWKSQYSGEALAKRFNASLTVDDSDLGIQLAAKEKINDKVTSQKAGASLQRQEGAGFIGKSTLVSGQIQTPAALQAEGFKAITPDKQQAKDEAQLAALLSNGDIKVIPTALGIFLNTLLGTVAKNFQEKGILPFGIGCINVLGNNVGTECANSAGQFADSGIVGGRRAAQELFSDFLTVTIKSDENYDILGDLGNCEGNGVYNCRADSGLIDAIQESNSGNPFTIGEALAKGWLHPDWKLIPPSRVENSDLKNFCTRAYCYSNLKVLRQLSILPIGFEIAAENSDPDKPSTLKQVVDGFNDCDYIKDQLGNVVGITYDRINKPFCHLVDPSWVVKVPSTRCNAKVFGPTPLSSGVPDRLQECADLQSCIAFNKDGTCQSYAYCTREKNTWRFDADKCDAQFATCRSFRDATGKDVAYLYRTLDTGSCNQDNVGCQAYSLNQDAAGKWLPVTAPVTPGFENSGIHFNNKVSSSCGANSAGCSAFQVASAANELLYLRQAPAYLKCYDSNPETKAVDWPENTADLAKLQPKPECKNYAGACIPDEVQCNWYTPVSGGGVTRIPGRYKPADQTSSNDQCAAKCVGYAAYREMPSNYGNGQNLAYIIPSSGASCSAGAEGCSSFTNLSTATGGVEQVEHYSYLRACVTPERDKGKNFVTYEGSKIGGYQLKTYRLVENNDPNNGPVGAPKYFYKTDEDLKRFNDDCSETRYKAGTASLDCRQFNDEQGRVYYRLLAQTIPVAESCTPYRLNSTELYPVKSIADKDSCDKRNGLWQNDQCQVCFQNGEYRDGFCFYSGLPDGVANSAGASRSCSAGVDTCRAYKGNAGNNIKELFNDTFEGAVSPVIALKNWEPISAVLSPESTRVGEHSLEYTGNTAVFRNVSSTPGKSYDLTFWAKGSGPNVPVSLTSLNLDKSLNFKGNFGTVGVGDVWNYYHLGPIEFGGTSQLAQLMFDNPGGGKLYLDNVRLVEVADFIYLVKKSLSVDPVCDSTPNDNLPGEALGCTAYKDPANNTVFLKNFSYLCRAEAVGCTALQDTRNTITDNGPRAYSVWLAGPGGQKVTKKVGNDSYSCQVPTGALGCYQEILGHQASEITAALGPGAITPSTVYIPEDTPTSTPVYLVADKAATCNQVDVGCSYAGLENKVANTSVFKTVLIKNNPDDPNYSKTLCTKEAVGCNSYSDGPSTVYFKDPAVVGQKICSYKPKVSYQGNDNASGWFWKGVGVCKNAKFCSQDAECGEGDKCDGIGNQPCYPDYIQSGSAFGLWSYGNVDKYQNFAGECPREQNRCTEFIDHNDKDRDGNDQAYYLINNDRLSGGDCNGKVGQKDGCALLDQTDTPNKSANTAATYDESAKQNGGLVAPSSTNKNDANRIVKVKRDRACGEWLQCRSSHQEWDEKNSKWKTICDIIGRCDKFPEVSQENTISNCANWIDNASEYNGQVLTPEIYVNRDISWKGRDFDGFSIPGTYPVEELSQVNINAASSDWRLVKPIPCGVGPNCIKGASQYSTACAVKPSVQPCGRNNAGSCVNGVCMQTITGRFQDIAANAPKQICRAYPENNSPFPNTTVVSSASQPFSNANLCEEANGSTSDAVLANACECDYTKVNYGDTITKYWNYIRPNGVPAVKDNNGLDTTAGNIPDGVCQGGSKNGWSCSDDSQCGRMVNNQFITDGICQRKKKENKLLGWRGFCLEDDLSRIINADPDQHPCLTWLPVDYLKGAADINNQHAEAGYVPPPVGGRYYCLEGNAGGGALPFPPSAYPQNHYLNESRNPYLTSNSGCGNDTYCRSHDENNGGQFRTQTFDVGNSTINLVQTDIEKIIFTVANGANVHGGGENADPLRNTVFELWPNDPSTGVPQAQYTVEPKGSNKPGHAATGKYLGKDNEFILIYGSATKNGDEKNFLVDDQGNVCNPAINENKGCNAFSGNVFKPRGLTTKAGQTNLDTEGIWDPRAYPNSAKEDSTDSICPTGSGSDGNWHAIRIKFDSKKTKKFIGYDIAYCDNSDLHGDIEYQMTFKLREWCRGIADATISYTDDFIRTVPWTNRLWVGNTPPYQITNLYTRATPVAPFGSLGSNDTPAASPIFLSPFSVTKECQKIGGNTACSYAPSISTLEKAPQFVPGAPFSCLFPDGSHAPGCTQSDEQGKEANSLATGVAPGGKKASDLLGTIFASVRNVFDFDAIKGYQPGNNYPSKTEFGDFGKGAFAQNLPKPPLVFPVGSCLGDKCFENNSKQGITVNGQVNGDVRFYSNTASVILKFFAFADANQMPLRQLKVDWGDNYTGDFSGIYRNHRGFATSVCQLDPQSNEGLKRCQSTQLNDLACGADGDCQKQNPNSKCSQDFHKCFITKVISNTPCVSNDDCQAVVPSCVAESQAPDFGHIVNKTCDNTSFQFNHIYQCFKDDVSFVDPKKSNPDYILSRCGPGFPDGCCTWQPRVQVKDNWGWCNGTCEDADSPGGTGCYDASWKQGGLDECKINSGAFTRFNGQIIVAPK